MLILNNSDSIHLTIHFILMKKELTLVLLVGILATASAQKNSISLNGTYGVFTQNDILKSGRKDGIGMSIAYQAAIKSHFSIGVSAHVARYEPELFLFSSGPFSPILTLEKNFALLSLSPQIRLYSQSGFRGFYGGLVASGNIYLERSSGDASNVTYLNRDYRGLGIGVLSGYQYVLPIGLGVFVDGRFDLIQLQPGNKQFQNKFDFVLGLSFQF
jgi:hypothetical protein